MNDPEGGTTRFTEDASECIREALRKLPAPDPVGTAAWEGLGSLVALLSLHRDALDCLLRATRTENFNRPARGPEMSGALRTAIRNAEKVLK